MARLICDSCQPLTRTLCLCVASKNITWMRTKSHNSSFLHSYRIMVRCDWCKISSSPPAKISVQRFPSLTETIISSYKVQADKTTLSSSIPQIRDEFEESNAASYREDSVCGVCFSHIFLSYWSATALLYTFELSKCCSVRIMNSNLSNSYRGKIQSVNSFRYLAEGKFHNQCHSIPTTGLLLWFW